MQHNQDVQCSTTKTFVNIFSRNSALGGCNLNTFNQSIHQSIYTKLLFAVSNLFLSYHLKIAKQTIESSVFQCFKLFS